MGAGTTNFFDHTALKLCSDEDAPLSLAPMPGMDLWQGLDTGFRKDPSAAVIARRGREAGSLVEIAEVVEIVPPKGGRLVPSETVKALLARGTHHGCTTVVADGHYIETVREHAKGFSLLEAPGGATGKAEAHVAARTLINEGQVRFSGAQKKLLQQLRDIVSKPLAGGQIAISSPRRAGSHGDLASACVLALWAAYAQRNKGTGRVWSTARSSFIEGLRERSEGAYNPQDSVDRWRAANSGSAARKNPDSSEKYRGF
jgi:hypothetical protein